MYPLLTLWHEQNAVWQFRCPNESGSILNKEYLVQNIWTSTDPLPESGFEVYFEAKGNLKLDLWWRWWNLYISASVLLVFRMMIYCPKHDVDFTYKSVILASLEYFVWSALGFNFGHAFRAHFHAITHTWSGFAAGHQSLILEVYNNHTHKMLFSVIANKLSRSVVASGEKQATADYRISKRYIFISYLSLCKCVNNR